MKKIFSLLLMLLVGNVFAATNADFLFAPTFRGSANGNSTPVGIYSFDLSKDQPFANHASATINDQFSYEAAGNVMAADHDGNVYFYAGYATGQQDGVIYGFNRVSGSASVTVFEPRYIANDKEQKFAEDGITAIAAAHGNVYILATDSDDYNPYIWVYPQSAFKLNGVLQKPSTSRKLLITVPNGFDPNDINNLFIGSAGNYYISFWTQKGTVVVKYIAGNKDPAALYYAPAGVTFSRFAMAGGKLFALGMNDASVAKVKRAIGSYLTSHVVVGGPFPAVTLYQLEPKADAKAITTLGDSSTMPLDFSCDAAGNAYVLSMKISGYSAVTHIDKYAGMPGAGSTPVASYNFSSVIANDIAIG